MGEQITECRGEGTWPEGEGTWPESEDWWQEGGKVNKAREWG